MANNPKHHVIKFIIMIISGILFNPMNALAYRLSDLYLSLTLFYGGVLMASNMIWSHEIVHYLSMGHINLNTLFFGIILSSLTTVLLLRSQFMVNDTQWLKRMISHHSTALTTSEIIKNRTKNEKIKKLAHEIIVTQEKEISLMKSMLE
jgi:hypothetical protein